MLAICVVSLLVLMGSAILPSKVYAGSSGSSDSGGSKDNDEQFCKKEAIVKKIKSLNKNNQPLPACTCGAAGTISKIDVFDANSGVTTVFTCSGCTGPQVPITSSTACTNIPDIFGPKFEEFCRKVYTSCKNVAVYRCDCPAVSTTRVPTIPLVTTIPTTEAAPHITSITPNVPVTTQSVSTTPNVPVTTQSVSTTPDVPVTTQSVSTTPAVPVTAQSVSVRSPTPFDGITEPDY